MLKIGHTESKLFSLPLDAVTQTFAILAKRGVGKSYTASVIAEEMLKASQPIVAIDPTGAWWGLREKFPVVIFGGEHADVPLEESAGEVIARAIVENRFPAVLDLSLFRKGQMIRFMVTFAETLYRLNREALHLFVDEADAVAPQAKNYGGEENRMLGAMEDIVRRGRKRGIGCTLITQRPAVLNKNVLTQCEILVALRLVHPKDIDAIMEWVGVHAEPDKAQVMLESLPSLPVGTAWFWAPGWGDIFDRVKVRARETFDSGATPKPGEEARKPRSLAAVDIKALGSQIAATVEKAKADDPAQLKRQIADLKKQLAKAATTPATIAPPKIIQKPVLKDGQVTRLEKIAEKFYAISVSAQGEAATIRQALQAFTGQMNALPARRLSAPSPRPVITANFAPRMPTTEGITPRQQRFLDAAAALQTLGITPDRESVCGWIGVHPRGGSVGEELKALVDSGLVTLDRGQIIVTDSGMSKANHVDPDAAIEQAKAGLANRQRDFFEMILAAYPNGITREQIAEEKGIHPRGGSLGEDLRRLVGRGLVERDHGVYRARDFLFANKVG